MKKKAFIFIIVILSATLLVYLSISQFNNSQVSKLLLRYDIDSELTAIRCSASADRMGHCSFTLNSDVLEFRKLLIRDLSERKPKYQNIMPPESIGDGRCHKLGREYEKLLPITQLGGDDAPYLGAVFVHNKGTHGCLEFEFGFG